MNQIKHKVYACVWSQVRNQINWFEVHDYIWSQVSSIKLYYRCCAQVKDQIQDELDEF